MDAVKFIMTVRRICKNQSREESHEYKNDMCCMEVFYYDSIKSN